MTFTSHMDAALAEARAAAQRGEVPVGAVLVGPGGAVVAAAGNRTANWATLRRMPKSSRSARPVRRLAQSVLSAMTYTSRWNLARCAPAPFPRPALHGLYYGADDPKSGGVAHGAQVFSHPQSHHVPEVYEGIGARDAEELLKSFFADKR